MPTQTTTTTTPYQALRALAAASSKAERALLFPSHPAPSRGRWLFTWKQRSHGLTGQSLSPRSRWLPSASTAKL